MSSFEELKPILRPTGVHRGEMAFDPDKCTSCGLCIKNCVFSCLEMGPGEVPRMVDGHVCFSCFNCMVVCPADAVSIVSIHHVKDGFYDTGCPEVTPPLPARDAEGNPAGWTEVEKLIFNRRSTRNFKPDPVPEPLIRRVLEAGRFAPSAGNHQPWKFTVVTDPELLDTLENACAAVWEKMANLYRGDDTVMEMVRMMGEPLDLGTFDPRVQGGISLVGRKKLKSLLDAPAAIFIASHEKMVGQELQVGICGQNMNLAALSLGLGFCWSGFACGLNFISELKARLGLDEPWRLVMSAVLGYPRFKHLGMVPRHNRPVLWFRPGQQEPELVS